MKSAISDAPLEYGLAGAPRLKGKKRRRTEKRPPFFPTPLVRQVTVAQRQRTEAHRGSLPGTGIFV
jgi:hypothetical protein